MSDEYERRTLLRARALLGLPQKDEPTPAAPEAVSNLEGARRVARNLPVLDQPGDATTPRGPTSTMTFKSVFPDQLVRTEALRQSLKPAPLPGVPDPRDTPAGHLTQEGADAASSFRLFEELQARNARGNLGISDEVLASMSDTMLRMNLRTLGPPDLPDNAIGSADLFRGGRPPNDQVAESIVQGVASIVPELIPGPGIATRIPRLANRRNIGRAGKFLRALKGNETTSLEGANQLAATGLFSAERAGVAGVAGAVGQELFRAQDSAVHDNLQGGDIAEVGVTQAFGEIGALGLASVLRRFPEGARLTLNKLSEARRKAALYRSKEVGPPMTRSVDPPAVAAQDYLVNELDPLGNATFSTTSILGGGNTLTSIVESAITGQGHFRAQRQAVGEVLDRTFERELKNVSEQELADLATYVLTSNNAATKQMMRAGYDKVDDVAATNNVTGSIRSMYERLRLAANENFNRDNSRLIAAAERVKAAHRHRLDQLGIPDRITAAHGIEDEATKRAVLDQLDGEVSAAWDDIPWKDIKQLNTTIMDLSDYATQAQPNLPRSDGVLKKIRAEELGEEMTSLVGQMEVLSPNNLTGMRAWSNRLNSQILKGDDTLIDSSLAKALFEGKASVFVKKIFETENVKYARMLKNVIHQERKRLLAQESARTGGKSRMVLEDTYDPWVLFQQEAFDRIVRDHSDEYNGVWTPKLGSGDKIRGEFQKRYGKHTEARDVFFGDAKGEESVDGWMRLLNVLSMNDRPGARRGAGSVVTSMSQASALTSFGAQAPALIGGLAVGYGSGFGEDQDINSTAIGIGATLIVAPWLMAKHMTRRSVANAVAGLNRRPLDTSPASLRALIVIMKSLSTDPVVSEEEKAGLEVKITSLKKKMDALRAPKKPMVE